MDKASKSKDETISFSRIKKEYYCYSFYRRAIPKYKFLACLTSIVKVEPTHNEGYRLIVVNSVTKFL